MKAKELFTQDGETTEVFVCSKCRCVYRTEKQAERCCVCSTTDCEKPRKEHSIYCEDCRRTIRENEATAEKVKYAEAMDKTEEVKDYDYIWFNEKAYSDAEILADDCDEDGIDIPEFVFAMKPVMFTGFSACDLFDNFNEDTMLEDLDVRDCLDGIEEFVDAFKVFNELNKTTTVYWIEDRTKKVRCQIER